MRYVLLCFLVVLNQISFAQSNEEPDSCTLDFESIYDFDIGDIFQYKRTRTGTSGMGEEYAITIDKYQITNSIKIGDSISYSIEGLRLYYESNQQGLTYFHKSSILNDTLLFIDSAMHILNLCNDTALIKGHQDYYAVVFEQEDDTIIQKHIGGFGNLFIRNEENMLVPIDYEQYEDIYRGRCGLVKHVDYHFEYKYDVILEGYIKGSDTIGVISPDKDLIVSTTNFADNPDISIYPNPARDELFLILPDRTTAFEIEIYQYNGRKIKSCLINNNTVNIEDIKSGLYLIRILGDRNAMYVSKFIKD